MQYQGVIQRVGQKIATRLIHFNDFQIHAFGFQLARELKPDIAAAHNEHLVHGPNITLGNFPDARQAFFLADKINQIIRLDIVAA